MLFVDWRKGNKQADREGNNLHGSHEVNDLLSDFMVVNRHTHIAHRTRSHQIACFKLSKPIYIINTLFAFNSD